MLFGRWGEALSVLSKTLGFLVADALELGCYALLDLEFEVARAGRVGLVDSVRIVSPLSCVVS